MEIKVDQKNVHYSDGGRKKRRGEAAVILIHGAGMDRTVWQLQTRKIAFMGRQAIAVDLPGHGRSEGPPLQSITEMSHWIISFMDAMKLKKARLIGHSMGAFVALEAAAKYKTRVDRLCLMGISSLMPVHPDLLMSAKRNKALSRELIVYWGLADNSHIGGHPHPGLWVKGVNQALLNLAAPGVLHRDLLACNRYKDAMTSALSIKCPSLFILGAMDKMTPLKNAQKLKGAIPQSKSYTITDCGHMMMTEKPIDVQKVLGSFI